MVYLTQQNIKQTWKKPTITEYGSVEKITQQGGGNFTDVPSGTPINGNINNVIGPPGGS